MTNDEIETRIERLETQQTALTVLVHCLLPATVPAARHQVLSQFGQYCRATEVQAAASGMPAHAVDFHLRLLASMYEKLEGALQLIEQHEKRHGTAP